MSDPPARHLDLAGASNFRDLGGYATRDGRTVRWRKLFRSNHLGHLTASDSAILRELGVRSAFDFRGQHERSEALCGMEEIETHSLPVEPTVVAALRAIVSSGRPATAADALEVMRDSYRGYVEQSTPRFRALFAHLLQDRAPLVIHCTAGKDRTGFAAAMILLALDVPRPVVMRDYLLTNQLYRMPAPHDSRAPREVLQVLWRVQEDFLNAALDIVEQEDGGVRGYLSRELRVGEPERRRLQALYLAS